MSTQILLKSLLLMLLTGGCVKQATVLPVPPIEGGEKSKLNVVWVEPATIDTSNISSYFQPIVINSNEVMMDIWNYGEPVPFVFRNMDSGKQIGVWAGGARDLSAPKGHYKNGILILTDHNDNYAVDAATKSTLWHSRWDNDYYGSARCNIAGDYFYQPIGKGSRRDTIAHLMRTPLGSNAWDTVYTESASGRYDIYFEPPSLWKNTKGEEILIFQSRELNIYIFPMACRINLIAYNLTTQKLQFKLSDLETHQNNINLEGGAVNQPPLIVGDKCFFPMMIDLLCIDLNAEKVIWRKNFGTPYGAFTTSWMVHDKDKLIFKTSRDEVYCLNPNTGAPIWTLEQGGLTGSGNPIVYKDHVYYITMSPPGNINRVNLKTGKRVWFERTPGSYYPRKIQSEFYQDASLGLDEQKGYMFFSDTRYHFCIKLPDN